MFFIISPGRLPLTPTSPQASQASETQLLFQLDRADQLNHVVVAMTGEAAFPEGLGATVHMQLPTGGEAGPSSGGGGGGWRLLGCLTNEKPSAIFRLKGLGQQSQQVSGAGMGDAMATGTTASNVACLGISVEPLETVQAQMATLPGAASGNGSDAAAASGQLVKAGARAPIDPQAALALAPKIGEFTTAYRDGVATTAR